MTIFPITKERQGLEKALLSQPLDFSKTYMAVNDLYNTVQATPDDVQLPTIKALEKVLQSSQHISQKQSLFLYRQAAKCLAHIPIHSSRATFSNQALSTLKKIVLHGEATQHRAASEALGSLPVNIPRPLVVGSSLSQIPSLDWNELIRLCNIPTNTSPKRIGRSLILMTGNKKEILVVKLSKKNADHTLLQTEAVWMKYLIKMKKQFSKRFDIPVPFQFKNSYLFRIRNLPKNLCMDMGNKNQSHGIAFFANSDYFTYPNEHCQITNTLFTDFQNIISQNAWLLGNLTASGIIHTAPIPLFHNRVQRHRRADRGIYEWPRGGRLDRWLSSSQYPNMGITGIRDFEHIIPFTGSTRQLYEIIGTHMLSLVLVIGSYFRNKKPDLVGLDKKGHPVDTRHLFDPDWFGALIQTLFHSYYKGFTGTEFQGDQLFQSGTLTLSLIEEMGVDRHMEEVLRAGDIQTMNDKILCQYLVERGYHTNDMAHIRKLKKDVVINTGPHLGGFNQRISVPGLISFLETVSALCIWGKFTHMPQ